MQMTKREIKILLAERGMTASQLAIELQMPVTTLWFNLYSGARPKDSERRRRIAAFLCVEECELWPHVED